MIQGRALRPYYLEATEYIESARSGSLEPPLSIEAYEGVSKVLRQHTPSTFEPEVGESVEAAAQPLPMIAPAVAASPGFEPGPLTPPPDPVGEIDAEKTRRYTMASGVNHESLGVRRVGEKGC